MKSVMISIRPEWCELIANGKKTVEVRKTRPKIDTPFKCYIYETKGKEQYFSQPMPIKCYEGKGKVIGEFVCDCIHTFTEYDGIYYGEGFAVNGTCLTNVEMQQYGQEKDLYGWHISELKIYDKPKELSEFKKRNRTCYYDDLGLAIPKCEGCKECNLKRPPQSWCYVEELEG